MKALLFPILTFLSALICFGSEAPETDQEKPILNWFIEAEAAMVQAEKDDKILFMFFTGSDWCGWCKRLEKEILETEVFSAYAMDHLILLKLDFPARKVQSEGIKKQNDKLKDAYNISGYPTIILNALDDGPTQQLKYMEGGPKTFVRAIKRFTKKVKLSNQIESSL